MKTRGVLFDLYGTLIQYGDMEKAWNAWYGVIYEAFRGSGLQLSPQQFRPFCEGFFERPEPMEPAEEFSVVERRLMRLGKEVAVEVPRKTALQAIEESIEVWHNYVVLDPSAMEVLSTIRQERSLALVSNFDYAPYVHRLMGRSGLEPLFHTILVSDAVGFKKPQPEIFAQALQELGIAPEQAVHVGDSREDVEGAQASGIRPIWIDRKQRGRGFQPGAEVSRVRSLKEVLDHLD